MRDMRMVDCDVLHYVRPIFLVEPGDDMPIENVRFENVRAHTDLHPRTEATIRFQPIVNVYTSKTPGHVRDITVDGLHLYGPRIPLKFWISGYDADHRTAGVTLRNVEINGTPLVWESAARTTDEGAEDVWFDGENHPDKLQRAYGIGHWVDSVTLDSREGRPVTLRTGKDAKTDVTPAYGWRGLLLDSSRHFFSVPEIRKTLDTMAAQGLNVLHWHLVDGAGWRFRREAFASAYPGARSGFTPPTPRARTVRSRS